MVDTRVNATNSSPATVQYTVAGPKRYRAPPTTGPTITPASNNMEFNATALGNASGGTRLGVTAWLAGIQKARFAPNTPMTAKIGQTLVNPDRDSQANIPAHAAAIV